jgi:hypothetical protein
MVIMRGSSKVKIFDLIYFVTSDAGPERAQSKKRLSQKGSLFGFMRGQKKEEAEAFLI